MASQFRGSRSAISQFGFIHEEVLLGENIANFRTKSSIHCVDVTTMVIPLNGASTQLNLLSEVSRFFLLQSEAVTLFWLLIQIRRKRRRRSALPKEVVTRQSSLFLQRLNWERFIDHNGHTPSFRRHIRMDYQSFCKLVGYIRERTLVQESMAQLRGGIIIPEIRLYAVLRWLAGGSYSDILYFCGISKSTFFSILWSTIAAINGAKELEIKFPSTTDECLEAAEGFRSISTGEVMDACVCVLDGYHLLIRPPSKSEAGNVRSFYSGHYSSYGLNIQGACDHLCRFIFLGVAAPGVVGDRDALFQCPLGDMVERLPGLFFAIGDAAYTPTEHLVPIFGGQLATVPANSNFNFYASQCRIRIEMAFGLMVQKWGILKRPLTCRLSNVKHVVICIARLHNYCINERIEKELPPWHHGAERTFSVYEEGLRAMAALNEFGRSISNEYPQWSLNRDRLVSRVAMKGLKRPVANTRRTNAN